MRIYEVLWKLEPGTLGPEKIPDRIRFDAQLGARVIRVYARDWLGGIGRFAALCLPYLLKMPIKKAAVGMGEWFDTGEAGEGDDIPDGLAGIDEGEAEGAIHPSEDPEITGLDETKEDSPEHPGKGDGRVIRGGRKNQYRSPSEYIELMKSVGVKASEDDVVGRYYRERALPHLIRFPSRIIDESSDPLPEGLDVWNPGSPLPHLDMTESLIRSPHLIPGVTTVERLYGTTSGGSPEREPVDLYLGVDCSGSMLNPRYDLSYPVLAGTVIVLSALRAGAKVMTCLSGEPGSYTQTEGFGRDRREILRILTGYLGTGYAFGILRLKETFLQGEQLDRPAHILVVTDSDIFYMLKEIKEGWDIARRSIEAGGGGGTLVLHMQGAGTYSGEVEELRGMGWKIHFVTSGEELVAFARAFVRETYETIGAALPPGGSP